MITILGPTATGKTSLAAHVAFSLGGEVISADSRQVYRKMDIGTGKDLGDYYLKGKSISYHLIDIVDPGYEFSIYEYQKKFIEVYNDILKRKRTPILCGGSGLYIESILNAYDLIEVPRNEVLRLDLSGKKEKELVQLLKSYGSVHNTTDITDKERLIRAIEIRRYTTENPDVIESFPKIDHVIFGIKLEREKIRENITNRLKVRLENGMLEEVQNLLDSGLNPKQLMFYGLEYKFITQYLIAEIKYEEMFRLLNTAIHQYAKRQMTWFRRMEKQGFKINWIDGNLSAEEKAKKIINTVEVKKEAGLN
ncbi:tRNA (adenosine(37)-N6)-dimethylallyltransferase MiaA [Bacteroidota bacterium]